MNKRICLSGSDWLFKDFYGEDWRWRGSHLPEGRDTRHWRTGSVPGCPHHDLWLQGEIPDPYVERNSLLCEWIPQRTWIYKKSFTLGSAAQGQRALLRFEGVDYQAEFFLNGESLGTHTGMFTPAVFDVTGVLRYGRENLLAVVIEAAPSELPQVGRTSRVQTLKTRMNYWWDFCPRLVHLGIWDDVYLELTGPVRLSDVFVRPQLSADFRRADVLISTELETESPLGVDLELTLRHAGTVVAQQRAHHDLKPGLTRLESCLEVSDPHLWWPNGYGEQALYEAEVRVLRSGAPLRWNGHAVSAQRRVPFGIRRLALAPNDTADPSALPYTFVVNGRRVYAKGWNWVPMDVMYSVPQPAKLERLLELAKRAHVNLLRVWGGGLIERESFYDTCDRLGLLVWQEFPQSSSGIENTPSSSPEYVALLQDSAEQIIPRRRNHPSLALWCGGNELGDARERPLDDVHPALAALKAAVRRLDPDRLWLPTSPSGPVFGNSLESLAAHPGDLHDVHGPWEYQGVRRQYDLYNRGASLFHSEFGVEGLANRRTLDATLRTAHQWPVDLDNPYWFHRGAWWVKRPVWDATFGELPDIDSFIRATQFMQAEGLRYALEADRRRKYHNSGTLPWQFNEPYPMAASTSAVDYYTRPKPSYYAVARAYAPLALSARFDTMAWGGRREFRAEAWVSSSSLQPYADLTLKVRLLGLDGRILAGHVEQVSVSADGATRLSTLRAPLSDIPGQVFFLDLQLLDAAGALLCANRYPFSRAATLAPLLNCPSTSVSVSSAASCDGQTVTLTNTGSSAAIFLWLEDARDLSASGSVYFDDNYFCLLPRESRTVQATWKDVGPASRCLELSGWNTPTVQLDLPVLNGSTSHEYQSFGRSTSAAAGGRPLAARE